MAYEVLPGSQTRLTFETVNDLVYSPDQIGSVGTAVSFYYPELVAEQNVISPLLTRIAELSEGVTFNEQTASVVDALAVFEADSDIIAEALFGSNTITTKRDSDLLFSNLEQYANTFDLIGQISQTIHLSLNQDPGEDDRLRYVKQTVDTFLAAHPEMTTSMLEADQPGSFSALQAYTRHYYETINRELGDIDWTSQVAGWRGNLKRSTETGRMKRLMARPARDRLAKSADQTPVLITDPLLSLAQHSDRDADSDTFGAFDPFERVIIVDPHTVRYRVSRLLKREPTQAEFLNYVERAYFHEGFHSIVGHDYYIERMTDEYYESLSDPTAGEMSKSNLQSREMWPDYYLEAMVEKLATAAYAEVHQPMSVRHMGELVWRLDFANNPKNVIYTPKTKRLTESHGLLLYNLYRLQIDVLFERLDWQAAGLKQYQAELLAARAFTELPGDRQATTNRQQFITAVSAASHPGFFTKINTLTKLYGNDLVLDMLLDPAFDIHDPQATPWIVSPDRDSYVNDPKIPPKLTAARDLYERGQAVNQPEIFAEHQMSAIEYYEQVVRLGEAETMAVAGLRHILLSRHPERVANSREHTLLAAIFEARPGLLQRKRPPEDLKPHESTIEQWVTLQYELPLH